MKNLFLNHIAKRVAVKAKPALEMEPNDPIKPTNVDALADVKKIDSDFEGLKTDKKPEDQNLEISKETKIGTEPAFDKEQEDYVAQGQEEGLALESLSESARADLLQAKRHRFRSYAMEDIAEVAQGTLDGTPPVQDVEPATTKEPGIDPEAAMMATLALDMDDLGENEQQSVAIEAFGFSRVAATESFIDRTINKSNQEKGESRSLVKRAMGKLQNFGQRVGRVLTGSVAAVDTVMQDMRDVGDAVISRAVLSDAAKSSVAKTIISGPGARSPIDALRQTSKQLADLESLVGNGWSKAVGRINDALSSGDTNRVVAASNDTLKFLARVGAAAGSKLPGYAMKLTTPSVTAETSYKAINYDYSDDAESDFKGTVEKATMGDLEEVRDAVNRAVRSMNALVDMSGDQRSGNYDTPSASKASGDTDGGYKAASRVAREIISIGDDMCKGAVFNTAWAVAQNGKAVAKLGVETITAARNTRNQ